MSLIPPVLSSPASDAGSLDERAPPSGVTRRWARLRWVARALLGVVFTAWSLLLIAWLTLHWGILPHIQQWREPIQERAGRLLGVPVRIGAIEVRSHGWVPAFELRDVELLGPDKQPALRLPHVVAAISARSLLSLELRFAQLLIDGAEVDVRRDASGHLFVGGLSVGGGDAKQDNAAADWFFAQPEFVVRGGALRWVDEQRNAPPLALTDVQLVLRNGLRSHDIRIDATPPADWGDRFSVVGRFTQPLLVARGNWRRWSGGGFASLPRADVHGLRQHLDLPFELDEGVGAARAWFEVRNGEPVGATLDLALRSIALRLAPSVEPLRVEELKGRIVANRTPAGVSLSARHVSFLTGDGIRWPEGDMTLNLRQRNGGPITGGDFSAQQLDLGVIAAIASRVPLGDAMQRLVVEVAPKGRVSGLAAQWDGALDAPAHYKVKGDLAGLTLAAHPAATSGGVGRPGLRNANVKLDATEAGGSAQLTLDHGELDLPGVFDEHIVPLDQFAAQLGWTITPVAGADAPRVSLQVRSARFANADAKGELSGTWSTGAGSGFARGGRYPGHLELDAKLTHARVERTARYLPIVIGRGARDYLEHALQAGDINAASFRVNGELSDFPFNNAKSPKDGEFRINARVDNARFAYLPGSPTAPSTWPALTKVGVDVALDHGALKFTDGQAQVGNVALRGVQGEIRDLETDARLTIDSSLSGPLAEMLHFVATTPVDGWIGNALEASTGTGNADLKLGLDIPLLHADASNVKGSLQLAGNDLRITPASPMLGATKGRVDFSNKTFAISGANARVYGGDLAFDGGLQPDGSLRFNGQGTASVDGLKRASELGAATRLASVLSGQAAYRIALGFVHGEPEVTLTSNLVGLAIDLPAPLAKSAEATLPLRVQRSLDPNGAAASVRDTLRLELGSIVQAQYQRELANGSMRVLRGGIGVMEASPQPASGVTAGIVLKSLAVDPWEAVADKLLGSGSAGGTAGSREAGAAADPTEGYAPDSINLRVDELSAGARRLTHLAAGLSQDSAGRWRANLEADQLAGYIEYRPPSRRFAASGATGRVFARLSRASIPKSDDAQVESLLDQQPDALPALDIVVDDFELAGKHLGKVEIEATNRLMPQGREWQLTRLNVTTPEAALTATGRWATVATSLTVPQEGSSGVAARPAAVSETARRTELDFKLALSDSGALLDRLGTSKVIRGGKGALTGRIGWIGSPFALDYPTLAGQINVAIDAGQFLKVDPGAARLLGVLSLQSLPRRLSLDFRDLFEQGFAFDNVTGDVAITQGVARTNNLRMRGVQAAVLMEGSADIAHESQDLQVVVVPEINAGTAALAYAVINPAIGLGAFLAQALLKKPLTAAGTREFHVSGSWADPKVERVERKLSDDVPNGQGPPPGTPAASAPGH